MDTVTKWSFPNDPVKLVVCTIQELEVEVDELLRRFVFQIIVLLVLTGFFFSLEKCPALEKLILIDCDQSSEIEKRLPNITVDIIAEEDFDD
jgi:hypothetical protein